jgi:hypothetical protein
MVPETSGIYNQMRRLIIQKIVSALVAVKVSDLMLAYLTRKSYRYFKRLHCFSQVVMYTVENSHVAGATSRRKSENCFVVPSQVRRVSMRHLTPAPWHSTFNYSYVDLSS